MMMRMRFLCLVLLVPTAWAFVVPRPASPATTTTTTTTTGTSSSTLLRSTPGPDPERMKQILQEEGTNPENMKATAEMMKNLKPQDIDNMLSEMDRMPASQKAQMKAMGMNPDIMRQSIEMMKNNPAMAKSMAEMMDKMTPEEMLEKSKQAQANIAAATGGAVVDTPVSTTATTAAPSVVDAVVDDDDDDDDEEESAPIAPPSAETLDTMYRVAELMSDPPTGKVSLQGFSTIPPVALLVGDDIERDLSQRELNECWADGSLGSTRVDRAGFERVWMEVQDFFSLPLVEKSRERSVERKKQQRGGTKPKPDSSSSAVAATPVPSTSSTAQVVGENISPEQLQQQVKNMSDTDMDSMLGQMKEMTPEQEARMKAMGVDPAMMQKTAEMLKSNPLMKNAAKMMMKNMSPEQMKQASQQAQEQMKNMDPGQMQKMMEDMEKQSKN